MAELLNYTREVYTSEPRKGEEADISHVGIFTAASEREGKIYLMPQQAHLFAESTEDPTKYADWVREAGIIYRVKQQPPTVRVETKRWGVRGVRTVAVDYFPPSAESRIYSDRTGPENLRELIQDRIDMGWTVDQELVDRLNLNVPTEG